MHKCVLPACLHVHHVEVHSWCPQMSGEVIGFPEAKVWVLWTEFESSLQPLIFISRVCTYCMYVYVLLTCLVTEEAWRRYWNSHNGSYKWLWATIRVLQITLRSSGRTAEPSLQPLTFIFKWCVMYVLDVCMSTGACTGQKRALDHPPVAGVRYCESSNMGVRNATQILCLSSKRSNHWTISPTPGFVCFLFWFWTRSYNITLAGFEFAI